MGVTINFTKNLRIWLLNVTKDFECLKGLWNATKDLKCLKGLWNETFILLPDSREGMLCFNSWFNGICLWFSIKNVFWLCLICLLKNEIFYVFSLSTNARLYRAYMWSANLMVSNDAQCSPYVWTFLRIFSSSI